jgi:plastocyanin
VTSTRRRWRGGALPPRLASLALVTLLAGTANAQSVLGHSPNVRGDWELGRWQTVFVFSHRFEFVEGGDELINFPTLTLAMGVGGPFAVGVDYNSNSEIVPARLGGNERQLWIGGGPLRIGSVRFNGIVARNSTAASTDGAVTAALDVRRVTLLGEARGYSNVFGTSDAGSALAGGALLRLTRYLQVSGDVARMLSPDTVGSVWSAGVGMRIPASPHTMSLHATNAGALTLQGASRPQVLGRGGVRYGFTFTVPFGSRERWVRIFRGDPEAREASDEGEIAARVDMSDLAYAPREVRIRSGGVVEWTNRDPVEHTVTADGGGWDSGPIGAGARYRRAFSGPGRYTYHCIPHPEMTAVVIVE